MNDEEQFVVRLSRRWLMMGGGVGLILIPIMTASVVMGSPAPLLFILTVGCILGGVALFIHGVTR